MGTFERTRSQSDSRNARKIFDALGPPFRIRSERRVVSASMGIVVRRLAEIDSAAPLHRTDQALYRAKAAGRGVFRIAE